MSTSGIVHDDTFCFSGTNYHLWKIRMLCHFWAMGPNFVRIVLVGASPWKDELFPSIKENDDMLCGYGAKNALIRSISLEVFESIMTCASAHEMWTKLEEIYGGSNLDEVNHISEVSLEEFSTSSYHEELHIASSSVCLDISTSSTSPSYDMSQGNDMVSGNIICDDDVVLNIDDLSCINANFVASLDLNTSSKNDIHSCVDSPYISYRDSLNTCCDDMLDSPCCHDIYASISSSCCLTNHVEEIRENGAHITNGEFARRAKKEITMLERKCYECQEDGHGYPTLDDEESPSPKESSSTSDVHMCLMARGTTEVSSTLSNDNDESDDECDRDMSQEIYEIGNSLRGVNKNTYEIFKDLITHFGKCNDLLHEEQEQNDKLDCNLLDALETLRDLESSKEEIEVAHDKLKEDFEHLDLGYKNVKGELAKLSKSYEELQATHVKSLVSSSSSHIVNDACATNSTSCEASILKENVELRAQLVLLTSNYGKLEESHEKLSGSHDDLLISHERLKLAHEAIVTKVTSCEPHVDISTISTQNALLTCASPSDSSRHIIPNSCDELLSLPCCSNNEVSTSSSTFVDTNLVEENKELKAQVTNLKKDLEMCHEGNSTLNTILSVQKSPHDKGGLGFISNNKKSKKKKKGQDQVKNDANITCFKCKNVGHHVRYCPLKKKASNVKQQGKRPQVQSQGQPQLEERPLPMMNQDNAPQVEKIKKKRRGSTCCYNCREKGHISSSCPNGNIPKPPLVNDHYSLRKDVVGNLFAKFVGAQSGLEMEKAIWVAKPIVTNFLGPNLVGYHQAQT